MSQNIFFVAVCRVAGHGIIVGSFSYNTDTDLNGVKQVLEEPNMKIVQGKHYSFVSGNSAWHIIQGNIIYYI